MKTFFPETTGEVGWFTPNRFSAWLWNKGCDYLAHHQHRGRRPHWLRLCHWVDVIVVHHSHWAAWGEVTKRIDGRMVKVAVPEQRARITEVLR